MTKAELELKIEDLESQIEEQKHLADAVEVKDQEIIKLTNLLSEKQKNEKELISKIMGLERKIKENEHLAEAINAKDKELTALTERSEIEKEKIRNDMERICRREIELLEKTVERRTREVDKLLRVHGSLLKSLQGTLDNAIELNEYVYNEVVK